MSTEFYYIAVALVTVLATARLIRLLTIDKFPPIKAVRTWYETKTDGSDWQWLTMCNYCMGPWAVALVVGTGYWAGVYSPHDSGLGFTLWWLICGGAGAAYLAAIFVVLDQDPDEDN